MTINDNCAACGRPFATRDQGVHANVVLASIEGVVMARHRMCQIDPLPFNEHGEPQAARILAAMLQISGHIALPAYLGSNTSVVVTLTPTMSAVLCGWGELTGWRAEFDVLDADDVWQRMDRAETIPNTSDHHLSVIAEGISKWLVGQYPSGYGPRPVEVPLIPA